ncbi:MAG: type 1 glutamine amidotransferase [Spirochaetes bacterium]|nr:type 1 glutamine amidotransferase [Spirochaetota bacterium]
MDKVKKIGMAVDKGFEDLEFWAVYIRLKEENSDIIILSALAEQTFHSKSGGLTATSEKAYKEVNAAELDALLIPGGWAPDRMRRDKDLLKLIRDMDKAEKILGFICHAGWLAASAKIMKNRKFTGSEGIKDDLENAGGNWIDLPAFREGNLVWGRVVKDIPEYNRELVKAIFYD